MTRAIQAAHRGEKRGRRIFFFPSVIPVPPNALTRRATPYARKMTDAATDRAQDPWKEDRIRYLSVDQFGILGERYFATSCTTVALYMGILLTYNDDPMERCVELVERWMTYASVCWADRFMEHRGAFEHPNTVYARSGEPKKCLKRAEHLDIAGISVVRKVAAPTRAEFLTYGVQTALDKLAKELMENQPQCHTLACVFVRYGASIAVVIKTDRSRTMLRIDVLDSHRRILPHVQPPPDLPYGSAVWGRFYGTAAAAQMIESIFPPSPSDEDLDMHAGVVVGKEEDSRRPGESDKEFAARSELEKIPKGFFDVHVFIPSAETRQGAERSMSGA